MRSYKRNLPLLGCAVFGGLLAFGLARSIHSAAPLDRAQAVALTTTWRTDLGYAYGFPTYYWTGINDLIYVMAGQDGTPHLFRQSGAPGATARSVEGPAIHVRGGYAGQMSPDSKWFVEWHRIKTGQHEPTFVPMEGNRSPVVGKPTWGGEGVWTPSSDAMISGVWRNGAAADRYDPVSGEIQRIAMPGLAHFDWPQRIDSSSRMVGFAEGGFIMHFPGKTTIPAINYPNLKLVRVDLSHPSNAAEQWTVPVPGDLDNGTCLLSPSGDRILWILHGDTTPALIQKLRRYLPGRLTAAKPGYRWYVSGLHGEDMHEVASYPYQRTRTPGSTLEPYSPPRWLPDSKHISFIFKNTLYTRPVD